METLRRLGYDTSSIPLYAKEGYVRVIFSANGNRESNYDIKFHALRDIKRLYFATYEFPVKELMLKNFSIRITGKECEPRLGYERVNGVKYYYVIWAGLECSETVQAGSDFELTYSIKFIDQSLNTKEKLFEVLKEIYNEERLSSRFISLNNFPLLKQRVEIIYQGLKIKKSLLVVASSADLLNNPINVIEIKELNHEGDRIIYELSEPLPNMNYIFITYFDNK